nr:ribosomal protein L24 [Hymenolepis microstoma]
MKLEVCSYSGYKVYPGHGKRAIRGDGRQFYFLSGKCERSHYLKRNPREVSWTVLYRRKYRKGVVEETAKKRSKKVTKAARAFAGASMAEIMAKRNQNPEVRQAMREQALRALKEKQKAKEAERKAKKAELKKKNVAPAPKAQQQPKAAKKVGKPVVKGGRRF